MLREESEEVAEQVAFRSRPLKRRAIEPEMTTSRADELLGRSAGCLESA
jgi:hypothetical protein